MAAGPPLIRGHNLEKSNAELTNAIRSNIKAAQEAALAATAAAALAAKNASSNQSHRNGNSLDNTPAASTAAARGLSAGQTPPLNTWLTHDPKMNTISIPAHSFTHSGLLEDQSNYDITAKLFYLPSASPSDSTSISALRGAHAREAIDLVLRELHVPSIDLLIVSFPGVAFDEEDEYDGEEEEEEEEEEEAKEAERESAKEKADDTIIEKEVEERKAAERSKNLVGGDGKDMVEDEDETSVHLKTWHILEDIQSESIPTSQQRNDQPYDKSSQKSTTSTFPRIRKLGLAEFGTTRLTRFLPGTKVKPAVDQINIRDCCVVPKGLIMFAREHGIELLTHSDCTDILPGGTVRELLGEAIPSLKPAVGIAHSDRKEGDKEESYKELPNNNLENLLKSEIEPQWVIKYTAVVKDRGVIESKGYFAVAMLKDGKK